MTASVRRKIAVALALACFVAPAVAQEQQNAEHVRVIRAAAGDSAYDRMVQAVSKPAADLVGMGAHEGCEDVEAIAAREEFLSLISGMSSSTVQQQTRAGFERLVGIYSKSFAGTCGPTLDNARRTYRSSLRALADKVKTDEQVSAIREKPDVAGGRLPRLSADDVPANGAHVIAAAGHIRLAQADAVIQICSDARDATIRANIVTVLEAQSDGSDKSTKTVQQYIRSYDAEYEKGMRMFGPPRSKEHTCPPNILDQKYDEIEADQQLWLQNIQEYPEKYCKTIERALANPIRAAAAKNDPHCNCTQSGGRYTCTPH